MFILDDLVKDASLTSCDRKRTKLQLYLVDRPPMRYDLNLPQFISNLMESMCLVHGSMKCSVGWLKLMATLQHQQKEFEQVVVCW